MSKAKTRPSYPDIAREAGVHLNTVQNFKSGLSVSGESKRKIEEAEIKLQALIDYKLKQAAA